MQKERQAAQQAALDRSRRMLEADDLDSESDSDDDDINATDNLLAIGNAARGGDSEVQMSFDIFVKGQQMRVARGKEDQGGRFRMFPFMERRGKKVDAYGETLDVGQWVRKGREIEEEGETKEVRDAKKRKEEEEEKLVRQITRQYLGCPTYDVAGAARTTIEVRHRK
jgi:cleavage and polyadenylation specificity factor subunit 2